MKKIILIFLIVFLPINCIAKSIEVRNNSKLTTSLSLRGDPSKYIASPEKFELRSGESKIIDITFNHGGKNLEATSGGQISIGLAKFSTSDSTFSELSYMFYFTNEIQNNEFTCTDNDINDKDIYSSYCYYQTNQSGSGI